MNDKGYSREKTQVLLGGWGLWKDLHATNPKMYPTVPEVLPTPPPAPPIQQVEPVLPPTATVSK